MYSTDGVKLCFSQIMLYILLRVNGQELALTFVVSVSVLMRKMQPQTTPYLFRRLTTRLNGKAKVVLVWPARPSFPFGGDKLHRQVGSSGPDKGGKSVMTAGRDPELAVGLPDTTRWGP